VKPGRARCPNRRATPLTRYTGRKRAEQPVVKRYSDYFKSFTQWGYTKQAMDYWAQRLRQKLDEIHGKKLAKG